MDISHLQSLRKPGRKIEGHAAILLPFEEDGSIAEKAYKEALTRTDEAGLGCAVNMDTGYANYLTIEERTQMLGWAKETLPNGFIAGVFVEGLEGDLVELYLTQNHRPLCRSLPALRFRSRLRARSNVCA